MAALAASGWCLADTVTLTNGDTLRGTVVSRTETELVLEHAVLGRVILPVGQVINVSADPDAPAAVAAEVTGQGGEATGEPPTSAATEPAGTVGPAPVLVVDPAPADDVPRGWFGTPLFRGWDTSLAVGFSGAEGNSENHSVNAQFKTLYEDDRDRIVWDNTYFLKSDSGERTQNEFKSELVRDWLLPDSKWFYFASGTYRYDDFEAWLHRVSGFAGMGYTWVKNDDFEFNTRLGAGATYDFGDVNELTPEALIGAMVVTWRISDNQTLSAANTLYPSFRDFGEYRNVSSVEWKLAVDRDNGMSFKFGLENEYESDPEDGDKANDLKYYGAIVWDF